MFEKITLWIEQLPLWQATLFLAAGAFFRAQTTFWLGKLAYHGIGKTKWGKKTEEDEKTRAGIAAIQRFGWPVIPLSFLTIGLQSAIQFGAGLLDWKWTHYTLVAVWGYLLWGFVYAAGGLALFNSIVHGSVGLLILFIILVILVWLAAFILVRRVKSNDNG